MKIFIASFTIAKQGGIVEYTAAMLRAFRELGHEADVLELSHSGVSERAYQRKIEEMASGEWGKKRGFDSQSTGYQLDETTGYWRNNYYGFYLPPSNRICVWDSDAIERWRKRVEGADIILWNFMPTKTKTWERKGRKFDFWWRFFDLPSRVCQAFLVHDAYFDVRASNISAFKDKILFLGCAHIAAYQCCSHIGIPRTLLLNPRYIGEEERMPIVRMVDREIDVFAAHMFKPMKHMEQLIAALPYFSRHSPKKYNIRIAGTGIEYSYMTSPVKVKPCYICSRKSDPDLPERLDGKMSLWKRAERESGMDYWGQMSGADVNHFLRNTKLAVDPSWSEHYSHFCRTHINGFIIEAMLQGAYPVVRDYRGAGGRRGEEEIEDPLFEEIRAVVVPWNATPREFGEEMRRALEMSPKKFMRDTLYNFEMAKNLFNAKNNAREIIRICEGGRKLVEREMERGEDSESVKKITDELMEGYFGIELPIEWETD